MNPSFPSAPPPPPPQGGPPGLPPGAYPPHAGPPVPLGDAPATASLPRSGILVPVLVLFAIGFFAFFLPIALLGAGERSPQRIYEHFREGGLGMWLITLAQVAALTGVTVAGLLRARGFRVPGAVIFGLPLMPFGVGALAALWSESRVVGAIAGESVDPSLKARIMAVGQSELSNLFVYGGAASATSMYLAAVAATISILSVDTKRVTPGPSNLAWVGALAGASVGFLAAAGTRLGLKMRWTGLDALVLLGLLSAGLLAALGGRKARFLVSAKQEDEASRAFRILVLAGVALAAALLFLDRASVSASTRVALGALGGESIDPSQRATIIAAEVLGARHGYPILMAVDVIACLLVFGAPVAAASGVAKRFSISGAVAAAAGALTLLLAIAAGSRLESDIANLKAPYDKLEQDVRAAGIALASVPDPDGSEGPSLHGLVLVKKDGSVEVQKAPPAGSAPPVDPEDDYMGSSPAIDMAADSAVPVDTLLAKSMPSLKDGVADRVLLLAAPSSDRRSLDELGPYAGLVGSAMLAFPVSFRLKLPDGMPPVKGSSAPSHAVGVLPSGESAKLVLIAIGSPPRVLGALPKSLPLASGYQANEDRRDILSSLKSSRDAGIIVLAPSAGETTGKVLEWISLLRASTSSSSPMPIVLTSDRAALEQEPAPPSDAPPSNAPSKGGIKTSPSTKTSPGTKTNPKVKH